MVAQSDKPSDGTEQDIFATAFSAARKAGKSPDEAKLLATRQLHQAGYYRTKGGWERLGPDLRGKAAIREAEIQPDGTYMVRDVEAFYPNAVKGADPATTWTPKRVRAAIENTNRGIHDGGQKPGVTRTHVYPEQKMLGINVPVFGQAINWRESDRGEGWARCDLIHLDPNLVQDWKDRKITGLSVGFVKDAGGLNERFGHVALLGGESQALSALPSTEVYEAEGLQLCYTTEDSEIAGFIAQEIEGFEAMENMPGAAEEAKEPTTEESVPAVPNRGEEAQGTPVSGTPADMQNAYKAMSTAYACMAAGEPGAEEKVSAAHRALAACQPNGERTMPQSNSYMAEGENDTDDKKKEGEHYATGDQGQGPQEESYLPEPTERGLDEQIENEEEVGDPPASNDFSADQVRMLRTENAQLRKELAATNRAVAALTGRQMRQDFSAEVQNLIQLGHTIDIDGALTMFSACKGDRTQIGAVLSFLKTTPKSGLVGAGGQTFSADTPASHPATPAPAAAAPAPGAAVPGADVNQQALAILRKYMPGENFTAEDVALGTPQMGHGMGTL